MGCDLGLRLYISEIGCFVIYVKPALFSDENYAPIVSILWR